MLENLKSHEGKELKRKLYSVEHPGWGDVVGAMVAEGVLGREKARLRHPRYPVADTAAHAALLAEIRVAAPTDGPLDERTATLLALAGPCQMLEVVAPERSDRAVAKRRIAEATKQVPATAAVKYVITEFGGGGGGLRLLFWGAKLGEFGSSGKASGSIAFSRHLGRLPVTTA